MSNVLTKIDKFLADESKDCPLKKKKLMKEEFEESDLNQDILDLLNSLDDDMLDDDQLALKDRILNANFSIEETGDDTDDFVDSDIDDIDDDLVGDEFIEDEIVDDNFIEEPGLDDIIDDDVADISSTFESKEIKNSKRVNDKNK